MKTLRPKFRECSGVHVSLFEMVTFMIRLQIDCSAVYDWCCPDNLDAVVKVRGLGGSDPCSDLSPLQ